jgi:hypothetical protein
MSFHAARHSPLGSHRAGRGGHFRLIFAAAAACLALSCASLLDPDKRAQIGAHYTDPEKIMAANARMMRPHWAA